MGQWDDYKCGVCGRTGLAWQACDYPGCPDGREPVRFPPGTIAYVNPEGPMRSLTGLREVREACDRVSPPRIDFTATYRVPKPSLLDHLEMMSWRERWGLLWRLWVAATIVAIAAGVVLGLGRAALDATGMWP